MMDTAVDYFITFYDIHNNRQAGDTTATPSTSK